MFHWRMKLTGFGRVGVGYSMWAVGDGDVALIRFLSELVFSIRVAVVGKFGNELERDIAEHEPPCKGQDVPTTGERMIVESEIEAFSDSVSVGCGCLDPALSFGGQGLTPLCVPKSHDIFTPSTS